MYIYRDIYRYIYVCVCVCVKYINIYIYVCVCMYMHIPIYDIQIQSTLPLVDTVLSGHLCLVDKSFGPGRMSLYFNMKLSVLSGPLSYVDNGHFFLKFGQGSLS